MAYIIFILITLALLVGFIFLSDYESRKGARVFARERGHLDGSVEKVEFILTHVDLGAFLREELHHLASRIAHDIAHLSLIAIRAVERFLTNIVRHLRTEGHATDVPPHENAREFVKTLSDFKGHLEATRPEVPDIY